MTKQEYEKKERTWQDKNKKLFDENISLKIRLDELKEDFKNIQHINSTHYNDNCRLKTENKQLKKCLLKVIDKM